MNRPVMPPTTAPIAPMLPAPMSSPMDQIDIFAPAPMANPAPMPMPMPMPAPMPMQGGIMGAVPFEDGGPVGMRRGGVTFKSGERFESGRGIAEQQAERRARNESYFGDISSDRGSEPPSGGGDNGGSEPPITKDDPITQAEVDAAFGVSNQRPTGVITLKRGVPPKGDMSSVELFDTLVTATQDDVMNPPPDSMIAPVTPVAAPTMDFVDPMTDLLAGEPGSPEASDDSFSMRQGRLFDAPVVYNSGKRNERTVSRLEDLENRMGGNVDASADQGIGFPSLGKLAFDALSGIGQKRATTMFDQIVNKGAIPVIDQRTNQIRGYIGEGFFGSKNAYSGLSELNPRTNPNMFFDESIGAFIGLPNYGESEERSASGQTPATPPPATDPADTTPPPLMITPPTTGLPPSVPDVLVPSTRANVPVTVPSILPTQGTAPTFLPQSFLDLLASFNRPAPRAMQDGGAVLDKAADDFLEALKVA